MLAEWRHWLECNKKDACDTWNVGLWLPALPSLASLISAQFPLTLLSPWPTNIIYMPSSFKTLNGHDFCITLIAFAIALMSFPAIINLLWMGIHMRNSLCQLWLFQVRALPWAPAYHEVQSALSTDSLSVFSYQATVRVISFASAKGPQWWPESDPLRLSGSTQCHLKMPCCCQPPSAAADACIPSLVPLCGLLLSMGQTMPRPSWQTVPQISSQFDLRASLPFASGVICCCAPLSCSWLVPLKWEGFHRNPKIRCLQIYCPMDDNSTSETRPMEVLPNMLTDTNCSSTSVIHQLKPSSFPLFLVLCN